MNHTDPLHKEHSSPRLGRGAGDEGGSPRDGIPGLPLLYFAVLFLWSLVEFQRGDLVDTLYQFLTLAYLLTLAAMYLLPGRPAARARGSRRDQIIALASANLLIPLSLLPVRGELPYAVVIGGLLVADTISWWALLTLRSSFSLTPEARRLVTGGPYRWMRHPLYLGGLIVGVVLTALAWSPLGLGLGALYVGATVLRMRAEDRLLRRAFPAEYPAYARRTASLVPGVF